MQYAGPLYSQRLILTKSSASGYAIWPDTTRRA
jgi:hypothetical protein